MSQKCLLKGTPSFPHGVRIGRRLMVVLKNKGCLGIRRKTSDSSSIPKFMVIYITMFKFSRGLGVGVSIRGSHSSST